MEQIKSDDDSDPSILALIVDANPLAWKLRQQFGTENMIDINDLIAHLIVFCHSYTLMHRSNRIIVIANHPAESKVIYPRSKVCRSEGNSCNDASRDDFVPFSHTLQSVLVKGLLDCVRDDAEFKGQGSASGSNKGQMEGTSSLAQALSISLCGTITMPFTPHLVGQLHLSIYPLFLSLIKPILSVYLQSHYVYCQYLQRWIDSCSNIRSCSPVS